MEIGLSRVCVVDGSNMFGPTMVVIVVTSSGLQLVFSKEYVSDGGRNVGPIFVIKLLLTWV